MTAESVEEFRSRARAWLAANMPPLDPEKAARLERDSEASWHRARELQKILYVGGFAGICFPREYGGLGLGYEYKKAFDAECAAYETPLLLNVPSFAICCATILDMGSEEQKRSHIHAALRGDEVLVQMLSEPSGGSDLAGVITRADRRDGRWIINGAKTWTTWAFRRRLRTVPGPDRLGRNKTRWTDDVPGAASPSGDHHQPGPAGQRFGRVLRRVFG